MIVPGVWCEAVRILMRLSPNCSTVITIEELSQVPLSERPPCVKQFHGVIELSGSAGGIRIWLQQLRHRRQSRGILPVPRGIRTQIRGHRVGARTHAKRLDGSWRSTCTAAPSAPVQDGRKCTHCPNVLLALPNRAPVFDVYRQSTRWPSQLLAEPLDFAAVRFQLGKDAFGRLGSPPTVGQLVYLPTETGSQPAGESPQQQAAPRQKPDHGVESRLIPRVSDMSQR